MFHHTHILGNIEQIFALHIGRLRPADRKALAGLHDNAVGSQLLDMIQIDKKRFVDLQEISLCRNLLCLRLKGFSDKQTFQDFAVKHMHFQFSAGVFYIFDLGVGSLQKAPLCFNQTEGVYPQLRV